jgi:hypothetical protein
MGFDSFDRFDSTSGGQNLMAFRYYQRLGTIKPINPIKPIKLKNRRDEERVEEPQ